jgi:P27 family predicted phage terminase small subunit
MGQRGPHPKPTNLRLLHGDRPDRINTDEPIPEQGIPECPASVTDPIVREVWGYTVKQLTAMRCITMADRDTLLCYCEAVAIHRKASVILAKTSLLVRSKTDGDVLVRNPAIQAQRDAALLVSRYAQHFGLSPSARSEIHTAGPAARGAASAARLLNG